MAATITRADVVQVPTDLDARFRAAVKDGNATVLVADRKVSRNQADVRVRADKAITNARALRAIEFRTAKAEGRAYEPITRKDVQAMGLDPDAPARGDLRARYLRVIG